MYAQLATLTAAALPAPTAPSFLKTAAITGAFMFVIGLIVVWQGAKITAKADQKKISDSAKTSANVGIGFVLIILGLLGALAPLIGNMLGFFTPYGG